MEGSERESPGMTHPEIEEILAYVRNELGEDGSFRVDSHLSGCRECASTAHGLLALRDRFEDVWEKWTADRMAARAVRARLAEARFGPDVDPALRKRASSWADRLSRATLGILGIVLDVSRKVVRISGEEAKNALGAGMLLRFDPVPAPARVRGPGRGGSATVCAAGPPWVKVTANAVSRKIAVRLQILEEPWPLALLLPKGEGTAVVRGFRRPEETDYLLAEFEDVPEGDYYLLIEAPRPAER